MNCKFCDEPIAWKRRGKKWTPLDPDGTRHQCETRDETGLCDKCGCKVWWVQNSSGSWVPLDFDGEAHYVTCSAKHKNREPVVSEPITTYPADPNTVFWNGDGVPWKTDEEVA